MKIAVVHPYRHHAHYVLRASLQQDHTSKGFFGYYYRGDLMDRILARTAFREKLAGYRADDLTKHIQCNYFIKILFLLSRKLPQSFEELYLSLFQRWVCKRLKEFDAVYVFQDYCNDVIRYAKETGMQIFYDQILAFNYEHYISEEMSTLQTKKTQMQIENLKLSTVILAPSVFVKKSLETYDFSEAIHHKIRLINYGGDVSAYEFHRRTWEGRRLKLLCVGTLIKRKGYDYLLDAMQILRQKNCDVQLYILGLPGGQESEEYLQQFRMQDNLNYLGTVPYSRLGEVFSQYDVFILPSLAEGSSLSVFDAMATGMPCIVTENTGSIVVDGEDGMIVEAKSAESIAEAVLSLYEHPEMVGEMSENARKNAQTHTWEAFETQLLEIFVRSSTNADA